MNIDETDADNELAVVEYIDEIYKFYKISEVLNYLLQAIFISHCFCLLCCAVCMCLTLSMYISWYIS